MKINIRNTPSSTAISVSLAMTLFNSRARNMGSSIKIPIARRKEKTMMTPIITFIAFSPKVFSRKASNFEGSSSVALSSPPA